MKRHHLTLVVLCLTISMHGQIERDKALHFVGGNLFGLVGAGIAKKASDGNRAWTFVGAVAGGTLIGLAKESVDAGQRENGWDNDDLLATILGGVTVGLAIELFSKKKEGKFRYSGGTAVNLESPPILFLNTLQTTSNNTLPKLTPFGFSSNILNEMEHVPDSSSPP